MPVFFQSFAAAIIGGAAAYATLTLLGGIFALTSLTAVLAQGVLAGTLGLLVFLFVLWGLSNKEFLEIRAGVTNFFAKRKLEPQSEF
jgi:ABC-type nickel/cobalt efflux system permease component RcnA